MDSRNIVVSKEGVYIRRFVLIAVICIAVAVAVLMYEFGLSRAGFNRVEAVTTRTRLEFRNRELAQLNKELSEKVAILETSRKIDQESYKKVDKELADLQSRILEQEEDIEFYKGIFDDHNGIGLRIQDVFITPGNSANTYNLRVVLAQAFRTNTEVSGDVDLAITGQRAGRQVRLKLQELAIPSADTKMGYSFRYFQELTTEVSIPADFTPERVHVIAHLRGAGSKTVEDFFVWKVK